MLFDRWRVEEDLERFRKANLPPEDTLEPEDSAGTPLAAPGAGADRVLPHGDAQTEQPITPPSEKIGAKDIFAMIIAVFSLILPFIITMIVVIGLFLLFFLRRGIF